MSDRAMAECPECRTLFLKKEKDQMYCTRKCARTRQARHGVPSLDDKVSKLADAVSKAALEIFGPSKK